MTSHSTATLTRQTFRTSRLLEYFSEKELTLQTGHEPERWPEVVLKELVDNALDAAESHGILPEIVVTVANDTIVVHENGPGLPAPPRASHRAGAHPGSAALPRRRRPERARCS